MARVFFQLIPTLTWMSPLITDLGFYLFGHGIDQLSRSPNVTPHLAPPSGPNLGRLIQGRASFDCKLSTGIGLNLTPVISLSKLTLKDKKSYSPCGKPWKPISLP